MKTKADAKTINARSAVAAALSSALTEVSKTGNLMLTVANKAIQQYKGEEIPKDDIESIANTVNDKQGWTGKVGESRMSEVRVILRAYAKLPKYLEALAKSMDTFSWHDALKLARCVNGDKSVAEAIAFVKSGKGGTGTANPKGRAVQSLVALFESVKGERRDTVRKVLKQLRDAGIVTIGEKSAEKVGL